MNSLLVSNSAVQNNIVMGLVNLIQLYCIELKQTSKNPNIVRLTMQGLKQGTASVINVSSGLKCIAQTIKYFISRRNLRFQKFVKLKSLARTGNIESENNFGVPSWKEKFPAYLMFLQKMLVHLKVVC